jgi:hypothetical protein
MTADGRRPTVGTTGAVGGLWSAVASAAGIWPVAVAGIAAAWVGATVGVVASAVEAAETGMVGVDATRVG